MPMPEWFWNCGLFMFGYCCCLLAVCQYNLMVFGKFVPFMRPPLPVKYIEHKPNATAQERHKELPEAYRAINRSGGKRLELEQDRMIDHVSKLVCDTDANPELEK